MASLSIEANGIPPRIILAQSLLKVKDEVIPNDILEKINDSCYFTSLLFMEVADPKIFNLLANAGTVKNTLDIIRSWNRCAMLTNTPVNGESTEDRKSDSICRNKVAEYLLNGKANANSGEGDDDDSEVKTLPESVLNGIDALSLEFMKELVKTVGEYLHDLDDQKISEDGVRNLIEAFPDALKQDCSICRFPIHSAVLSEKALSFIPLLAEMGLKYSICHQDCRGGLLMCGIFGNPYNVLKLLAKKRGADPSIDSRYLAVFKELHKRNLLFKSDVKKFELVDLSCHPESKERFQYMYELDKDCLFYHIDSFNSESLLDRVLKYAAIYDTDEASFEMALRICLQKLNLGFGGLLLSDEAPYQLAVDKFGKRDTFKIIKRCVPANTNIPVLHEVIEYTPEYLTDFASQYPSTIFLRDNNGRAFHHVALTSFDSDAFEENPMIFLQLSDEQIEDKDPELDLYPFMCAASNYHIDLTSIYYLLRRCPSVLDESRRMGIDDKEVLSMNVLKNEVSKKRKRDGA